MSQIAVALYARQGPRGKPPPQLNALSPSCAMLATDIDRLQLRGARLLLRTRDVGETRYGMIVIPDSAASGASDLQAEIVAVGPDLEDKTLAPGLTVVVRRTRRTYLEDDLWICDEACVLAVVE